MLALLSSDVDVGSFQLFDLASRFALLVLSLRRWGNYGKTFQGAMGSDFLYSSIPLQVVEDLELWICRLGCLEINARKDGVSLQRQSLVLLLVSSRFQSVEGLESLLSIVELELAGYRWSDNFHFVSRHRKFFQAPCIWTLPFRRRSPRLI